MSSTEQPRRAATVIPARASPSGIEVLVLQRGERSRFLPGYVVFPGGAVDPEDAVRAERWFGTPAEATRAAAIRELAEEAGLVATFRGLAVAQPASPLALVDAAPPRTGDLPEISRWVAPEEVPVRFDATYYALASSRGLEPRPDGREIAAAWWADPAEVLRGWTRGRVRLYWPTMKTMEGLARCGSVGELLRLRLSQREPVDADERHMPRSTFYQGR
jgi:8-oxo-dGTP pyrophosphatase MutT (NUDIX family)